MFTLFALYVHGTIVNLVEKTTYLLSVAGLEPAISELGSPAPYPLKVYLIRLHPKVGSWGSQYPSEQGGGGHPTPKILKCQLQILASNPLRNNVLFFKIIFFIFAAPSQMPPSQNSNGFVRSV